MDFNQLKTEFLRESIKSDLKKEIQSEKIESKESESEKPESEEKKTEKLAETQENNENIPDSLSTRLSKSRKGFFSRLKDIFSSNVDEDIFDDLEMLLIENDIGVKTSSELIEAIKSDPKVKEFDKGVFVEELKNRVSQILFTEDKAEITLGKKEGEPQVLIFVGVNGVGKTTSIAKLAKSLKLDGQKVLLAAGDTFRAAAVEQLKYWGDKIDVPVVFGADEAKPSSVIFDAVKKAKDEDYDILLIDTAGRLHNRSNLMQELEGIKNVIKKHIPSAPHESFLVVDGTTGQNALSQAKEFNEIIDLTGVIVTKLDGTPKGGIVVAIKNELEIPVRYIGVGESQEDLRVFNPEDFIQALFDTSVKSEVDESFHASKRSLNLN
ncbi:UNVERIFIED_CONTAM: hypothetical protein GTU68_046894 [Idotea baltica]|nr:hypothetical protein [Idotea baltica]